jgi:hypothetical protein
MPDRQGHAQKFLTSGVLIPPPRGLCQSQHPHRARSGYDEENTYDCHTNPDPGFWSGPGNSVGAYKTVPGYQSCKLLNAVSPGGSEKFILMNSPEQARQG